MKQNDVDHRLSFALDFYTVPEPPCDRLYVDILRWLLMVMDCDDPYLSFVAGCFSHALKYNGLTNEQAKAVDKVQRRVVAAYAKKALACQEGDEG